MLQRIDMLDVEQEQVRVVHQLLKFAEERLASGERLSTGVDTGVYAALLGLLEKLRQEVDLEQRFSTTHGDASLFSPIGAIAFGFGEEFADFVDLARLGGVMVKGTTLLPRRPWGARIAFRAFLQHTVEAFAS